MICKPEQVADLYRRCQGIAAFVFDVDGVFTNGRIIYNSDHQETKLYDAHDGQGIKMARTAGWTTGIISARESEAIRYRARELKIDTLYLGRFDKLAALGELLAAHQLAAGQVCFVGDDLPDIPVLQQVGLPVAVHNAAREVKAAIPFHSRRPGGRGALREIVEFILHVQGRLESVLQAVVPASISEQDTS